MMNFVFQNRHYDLSAGSLMGVLNVTPDSFSDGGAYLDCGVAVARAQEMRDQGASIIDIGGESTRPGSLPISTDEELARITEIAEILLEQEFCISIDSNKIEVQKSLLEKGVPIINDIFGGSEALFSLAEKHQAGLVLMHTSGTPAEMMEKTQYVDVVKEVRDFFEETFVRACRYKIPRIWFDPGIGFGKTLSQNLALMSNLKALKSPHWGLLLGASRKSWIGQAHQGLVNQRLGGSIAAAIYAIEQGVDLLRVHDVFETDQALEIYRQLKQKD